jgi:predicted SprT family Zn-dependent metalloprotease
MEGREQFTVDDLWKPGQPLPDGATLKAMAARCGRVWRFQSLPARVTIAYNPRMRSAAGRARLEQARVELNPRLLGEHPQQFVATLVHELAHMVVYFRHGKVRPHGERFRALMQALGLPDKATHDLKAGHLARRRRRFVYLHRCDGCGSGFVARSVHRGCYCAHCRPETHWTVYRAADDAAGRRCLAKLSRQGLAGRR